MNNSKGKIGVVIIWLALILISYYFLLVPINIQSPAFWAYLIIVLAMGAGLFLVNQLFVERQTGNSRTNSYLFDSYNHLAYHSGRGYASLLIPDFPC